jgi:2-polyprenyl-3-methyl-5-hydroxy-6-metoxy-1,4-benzoquinol methylase
MEDVAQCPFCGARERTLAYADVKDWAFGCAPGHWNYWNCDHCRSLYLHPRPNPQTIGSAYSHYYTHAAGTGGLATIKQRVRNEYWSQTWHTSLQPRLGLPTWLGWTLGWLKPYIAEPFGLRQWVLLPKGLMIDVGCGNGDKLKQAAKLGWQTLGIEMDTSAVRAATAQGLRVLQGGYELLNAYKDQADCIVCSHVLEHVHQPLTMLRLLIASLKPQGVLLLSTPNASSDLRFHYGENWRGLEAPRHLAIPDANWLIDWLRGEGFQCMQVPSYPFETAVESERIRRRALQGGPDDVRAARASLRCRPPAGLAQQDIVQLVCVRVHH